MTCHYDYSGGVTSNRERALDAAVELLGTQGVRALTHLRVDERAVLPRGSTSNCFRTRAALLQGVVQHMLDAELPAVGAALLPTSPSLSAAERHGLTAIARLWLLTVIRWSERLRLLRGRRPLRAAIRAEAPGAVESWPARPARPAAGGLRRIGGRLRIGRRDRVLLGNGHLIEASPDRATGTRAAARGRRDRHGRHGRSG